MGKRILLYSLSTFPVCLKERVCKGNAEGQYQLCRGAVTAAFQSMGILKQTFRPELVEKFFPREDEDTVYFAFVRLVGDKDTVCERPFFGDRSKPFEIILRYVAGCFNFYCDFTIDDIYMIMSFIRAFLYKRHRL